MAALSVLAADWLAARARVARGSCAECKRAATCQDTPHAFLPGYQYCDEHKPGETASGFRGVVDLPQAGQVRTMMAVLSEGAK